jgi:molybdenum cofactor cytidylyltransferase
MKFGETELKDCLGAYLAHSFVQNNLRIKKGTQLDEVHLNQLSQLGVQSLVVARLDEGDLHEDEAANLLGDLCTTSEIRREEAFTGRVNFYAKSSGMFVPNAELVASFNKVHPAITLATLETQTPVEAGRMIATLKIIPFAAPKSACNEITKKLEKNTSADLLALKLFEKTRVGLIATRLPHLKQSTMDKTVNVLRQRLEFAGAELVKSIEVDHQVGELKNAIQSMANQSNENDLDALIIFGASATIDDQDVVPLALFKAGGEVERFGMPVDPGNLLVLGSLGSLPVIGAPGCARSPAENGFDFVLYRLLSGQAVLDYDIAQMGVGGLLKEIHSRPQPRESHWDTPSMEASTPKIAALVLSAGQSRRMGEENKLLLPYNNKPMVSHAVEAAQNSLCDKVFVVTGHQADQVKAVLQNYDVEFAHNEDFNTGLSTSIRAGIKQVGEDYDGVIVLLGDMPLVSSEMINQMIEKFDQAAGITIVQAAHDGKGGNPVLWGVQYFEALLNLEGDIGARPLIARYESALTQVELGAAVFLDVDTKQAFAELTEKK